MGITHHLAAIEGAMFVPRLIGLDPRETDISPVEFPGLAGSRKEWPGKPAAAGLRAGKSCETKKPRCGGVIGPHAPQRGKGGRVISIASRRP